MSTPPEGSLLRIPLVAQMLADRSVSFRPRALDEGWYRKRQVSRNATGFRPFFGELLHAQEGILARWLEEPRRSARALNAGDHLVHDVCFMVHDYLHAWSYAYLRTRLGCADLGYGQIDRHARERHAFLHLVTEAAATVGLDYWYLATLRLDDVVGLGTRQEGLTVSYHERWLPEYRRAHPTFTVQEPGFFERLVRFYCTGVFEGFDARDVKRSAALHGWLSHELRYGERQRIYARQWLAYLAGDPVPRDDEARGAIHCGARWQRDILRDLGEALWRKVKDDVLDTLPAPPTRDRWSSPRKTLPDFRFVDVAALDESELLEHADRPLGDSEFALFFSQYVGMFSYARANAESRAHLLPLVRESKSVRATLAVMRGMPRIKPAVAPVRDVFFLS